MSFSSSCKPYFPQPLPQLLPVLPGYLSFFPFFPFPLSFPFPFSFFHSFSFFFFFLFFISSPSFPPLIF
jgi:hypothetical protein